MPLTEMTSRNGRAWALTLAAACLFAALVVVVSPGDADSAPLRVIDYLIVVPDPLKLGREELASLMGSIWKLGGMEARRAALEKERGRLRYFTDTSWNVKARS